MCGKPINCESANGSDLIGQARGPRGRTVTMEPTSIVSKVELLRLATKLRNVSQACRVMGRSRDTFYRYARLYARGGRIALKEQSRRRPVRKNRVAPKIEQAIVSMALAQPAWGKARVADELRQRGLLVSPAGVRSVWMRHDLQTRKLRIAALEAKRAQDGVVPTAAQWLALEKASLHETPPDPWESKYPGQRGTQDAFYVGSPEGPGRLYQQSFIDVYSKLAFVKLYSRNEAWTAIDLLRDRVMPFFEASQIPLCRVLTGRGSAYCGDPEHDPYERYLAAGGITHTEIAAVRFRTEGICAAFHRLVRDEFYRTTFRKRIYASIESLQCDLDAWLDAYNHERPHPGRYCYGKTPMRTFLDSAPLARTKRIAG